MEHYVFWALALFLVGLAIICLEMFIPSGGVLGFLAAAALFASVGVAFSGNSWFGLLMLASLVVMVPALLVGLVHVWPHTPIGKRVLISPKENPDETLPLDRGLRALQGRVGVAKTKMLPSGAIIIDGTAYDAISDGMPIDPGEPVRVISVRANRVLVRPATVQEALENAAPGTTPPPAPSAIAAAGAPASADEPADLLSRPLEEMDLDGLEEELK